MIDKPVAFAAGLFYSMVVGRRKICDQIGVFCRKTGPIAIKNSPWSQMLRLKLKTII